MLGHEPGQRRGEVVAQGHPLLVVVLEGEDALVGTVGVGQELAQGVGVFEGAGLQGLEAVGFIDGRHGLQNAALGADRVGPPIIKTAWRARAGPRGGVAGHAAALTRSIGVEQGVGAGRATDVAETIIRPPAILARSRRRSEPRRRSPG